MYCTNCCSDTHFTELCTRPKPTHSRFWLAVFAVTFFIMGPVAAFNLTDEERRDCEAQGGCQVFTKQKFDNILAEAMEFAHKIGYDKGKKACNSST